MSDDKITKEIVTKSNELIHSCYSFSLLEQQLLLFIVSTVDPFSKNMDFDYKIHVKDFLKKFPKKNKNIYADIEDSIMNKFWDRELLYWDYEKYNYGKFRWLSHVYYEKKEGYFLLEFSRATRHFLHQLKSNFTSYYIDNIKKFKSTFSIRIYEICICNINKSNKGNFVFIIELKTLREWLDLEKKYLDFYDFKRRVLLKAQTEINAHSDLNVSFDEIKEGRKVVAIRFHVERKPGCERATYKAVDNCRDEKTGGKEHDSINQNNPREESHEQINHGLEEILTNVVEENKALVGDIEYWLGISPKTTIRYIEEYGAATVNNAFQKVTEQLTKGTKIDNIPAYFRRSIGGQELAFSSDEWRELKKRKMLADSKKYIENYEKMESGY